MPVLPDSFVQFNAFDDTVKAYEENMKDVQSRSRTFDPVMMKQDLHAFLCSRVRVDRVKRQKTLDPLVDERIEILKKLSRINPDDYPFEFEREFK